MMDVERICAEYLRTVSPMAQRIAEDIDTVRYAYRDLWDALDSKDKNQVVDEALIDPAAVVKYANEKYENTYELEPLSNFSWFTQSQLNLFTHLPQVCESRMKKTTTIKCSDIISPNQKKKQSSISSVTAPINKSESAAAATTTTMTATKSPPQEMTAPKGRQLFPKLLKNIQEKSIISNEQQNNDINNTNGILQKGIVISKPKNPPPPPPSQSAKLSEMKNLLDQDDIPKTGFDFLDNW